MPHDHFALPCSNTYGLIFSSFTVDARAAIDDFTAIARLGKSFFWILGRGEGVSVSTPIVMVIIIDDVNSNQMWLTKVKLANTSTSDKPSLVKIMKKDCVEILKSAAYILADFRGTFYKWTLYRPTLQSLQTLYFWWQVVLVKVLRG